jgi:chemotaxis family two-component system sensor kinase Cph1
LGELSLDSPAFGQADLSNCERELIHLAGSVQPHGVLLLLRDALVVLQASDNCHCCWALNPPRLLERPLAMLDGDLAAVAQLLPTLGAEPVLCTLQTMAPSPSASKPQLHRAPGGGVVLELEPLAASSRDSTAAHALTLDAATLQSRLAAAVQRYTSAATTAALADSIVLTVRDLTGYDRVMVYRFDPDGHGKIIAEARDPRLESAAGPPLPGHRHPAARARAVPAQPRAGAGGRALRAAPWCRRLRPRSGEPLDMSMCTCAACRRCTCST